MHVDRATLLVAVVVHNMVGYLNRQTGEIVILPTRAADALIDAVHGHDPDYWRGVMVEQARVAADPEDWLEIPKLACLTGTDVEADERAIEEHVARFFAENGIDAVMVGE